MFECRATDCPNWEQTKKLVRPEGEFSRPILVIGEAPGAEEVREGRPFVGRSGQLLRAELKRAGFDLSDCCFTNTVWCRPPLGEEGENKAPLKKAISKCRLAQEGDWKELLPGKKLVLLFGRTASDAFMGEKKRGRVKKKDGAVYSSHFHPAYILRNDLEKNQFREDLALVATLYKTGEAERPKFDIIENYRSLKSLVSDFAKPGRHQHFSFDLETVGLDAFAEKAKIVTCSLSSESGTFVIPLNHPSSKLNVNTTLGELIRLFACQTKKIAQNGKFDILWLRTAGIEVKSFWHDTMIAQYLLNAREYEALGLKHLVWLYFPEYGGYEAGVDLQNIYDTPFEKLCEYTAMDAFLERKIAEVQRPLMEEDGLDEVMDKILSPATPALAEVEFSGFKADLPRVATRIEELKLREKELDAKIRAELPIPDEEKETFKLGSQSQMSELLFDKMKLPSVRKTRKGRNSVSKNVLDILAQTGNSVCTDILELRHAQKLRSTYLENYLEKGSRNPQGLIRCEYKMGARGGRLSSIHPNMQNLPKEMRDYFVSRHGDQGVVMALDFKQIELRVCALYARDPEMIRLFNDGVDMHRMMMAAALTMQRRETVLDSEITKAERQRGKSLNFGMIFGRGAQSLAEEFQIPLGEAQAFHDGFFHRFSKVKEFHDKVKQTYHETGCSFSMLGRRRFLGEYEEHEAERRAINFPIQSLASDVCLFTLIWLVERLWEMITKVVGTVHDSIVFDLLLDEADQVFELIEKCVDGLGPNLFGFELPFRFDVDIEVGKTWGSLEAA